MWLILALSVFALAIYYFVIRTWSYFAEQNVPYYRGLPLVGWLSNAFLMRTTVPDEFMRVYKKFPDDRIVGLFEVGGKTSVMIRDPELMKTICVKDFDSFVNHNFAIDADIDPILGRSLFLMKDQKWRDMRSILSPLFTGSKMRNMIKLIDEVSVDFVDTLKEGLAKTSQFNAIQLMKSMTCDVILSCAFGVKMNSLKEPDNVFYEAGVAMAYAIQSVRVLFSTFMPRLAKLLRIKAVDEKYDRFFRDFVSSNIRQRREKNIVRDDMIHLLMQAKQGMLKINEGEEQIQDAGFATISVAEEITSRSIEKLRDLDDNDFVAQCMLFFLAGFTGLAITNSLILYEFAKDPEIQERLFQEINDTKEELNGAEITYEVLQRMKYLDQVVSEALRLWPVAISLDRKVNKPFIIENTDGQRMALLPGDVVWFPIMSIHRDEKYFDNPEKFDPDRFSDENKAKITAYAPFGLGPRACVASRFALMTLKALTFRLVESFEFECVSKTENPLKFKKGTFGLEFENGIWLGIKSRE